MARGTRGARSAESLLALSRKGGPGESGEWGTGREDDPVGEDLFWWMGHGWCGGQD